MITGLTKGINLYLAPILSLTSLILIILSYLAPTLVLATKVALLTVTPSISLTEPTNTSGDGVDGPSVFIGPLGSCSRANNGVDAVCEAASVSPHYGTPPFICILRFHLLRHRGRFDRPSFIYTHLCHGTDRHNARLHRRWPRLHHIFLPLLHAYGRAREASRQAQRRNGQARHAPRNSVDRPAGLHDRLHEFPRHEDVVREGGRGLQRRGAQGRVKRASIGRANRERVRQ